jgi:ribose/xylose/arabinose/galactoside ABC-type transport system permease subunit
MVTNAAGQQVPAFESANKFFNPTTIVQIAKDTSFFAIMAVGMTIVIITGGIDLSIGSIYALASVCRRWCCLRTVHLEAALLPHLV